MKTKLAVSILAAPGKGWLLAAAVTGLLMADPVLASLELAKKNGCMMCHQLDKKGVGPSFMDISNKYKADAEGANKIETAIVKGSKDAWGKMPMAAMPMVSAADAKTLAAYILSLATSRSDLPTTTPVLPDPSQCATYDPSRKPQVQIPCIQIREGVVYAAGLNQVPALAGGLRFEVESGSVQPATTTPTENWAVLPLDVINRLYITCLDLGTSKPWVMLDLSNVEPVTFDLVEFGIPAP